MWQPRPRVPEQLWTQKIEDYFEGWRDRAEGHRYMHLETSSYYEGWYTIFGYPTTIMSALNTASLLTAVFGDEVWFEYVGLGLAVFVTIFMATLQYFKFEAKQEAHKLVANGFSEISNKIKAQLVLDPRARKGVKDLQNELADQYQALINSAYIIPQHIKIKYHVKIMDLQEQVRE